MAIGFNFQSLTGLANFGTNLIFRITSNEGTINLLNTGLKTKNPVTTGTAFGTLLKDLLAVEIPNMSTNAVGFYQSGSMYVQ
jgi:hypothetical protein